MRYWGSKKYRDIFSTGNVLMGTLNATITHSLTRPVLIASKVAPQYSTVVQLNTILHTAIKGLQGGRGVSCTLSSLR